EQGEKGPTVDPEGDLVDHARLGERLDEAIDLERGAPDVQTTVGQAPPLDGAGRGGFGHRRSSPCGSTRRRRMSSSSGVGAAVFGTRSGMMSGNPVAATTWSTVTPGCTERSRSRLDSSSKSRMQSGVTQYRGPPPGSPRRRRASAPPWSQPT